MPSEKPSRPPDRPPVRRVGHAAILLLVGLVVSLACQDPAGAPPTLDPGTVSFTFTGPGVGHFTADGSCYGSSGYPAADSACALAFVVGDTIRIRAVIDPLEFAWRHVNIDVPSDGECDPPGACRIAFDFLTNAGIVERSYRSTEATVVITEEAAGRIRGTFTGRLEVPGGGVGDTIRIPDGTFDVPFVP